MTDSTTQLMDILKTQGQLMSGRLVALLQAALSGQKMVNVVAEQAYKDQLSMLAQMPEELRVSIPRQFYSVVHGVDGKTKLQITIPVEETLETLQKTIDNMNNLTSKINKEPHGETQENKEEVQEGPEPELIKVQE